jgi:Protein kinase domain
VAICALLLATVSIIRTNPFGIGGIEEYQALPLASPVAVFSSSESHRQDSMMSFRPRVVFLDGAWNLTSTNDALVKRTIGDRLSKHARYGANYPLVVRPRTNSSAIEEVSLDQTRFYHVADSKDMPGMERRRWPKHDFDPSCVPMAQWQSSFYPVCNIVHAENDMRQSFIDDTFYLLSNKGYWRSAWKYAAGGESANTTNASSTFVWKTFKIFHNFEEKYYEDSRVDALAMERLTSSPYIVNLYASCGLTVVQEYCDKDLAQVVDGGRLNSKDKLIIARQIAKGVSDIHSIKGDAADNITRAMLVHNDINLANLMFTSDKRPVLNDFNIAVLLMKNNMTGETCPFYSNFPNPQWKAPEEQVLDGEARSHPPIVNEKIDVYAMGNIFYRIAVGAAVWKRPEAERLYADEKPVVARLKKYNGTLPSLPNIISFKARSDPALAALLQAMRLCYKFNPKLRPTATEVVQFLDEAIESIEKNGIVASLK